MGHDREYEIYKAIATYLKLQFPKVIYRFDMAGNNLSVAQAGKNKAIQCCKGYPDLMICKPRFTVDNSGCVVIQYSGAYLEIKKEGTKLFKKDGKTFVSEHVEEQAEMIEKLKEAGYYASFAIGLDDCLRQINDYLK